MKKAFLQLLSMPPIFGLFKSQALADVAPPVGSLLALTAVAMVVLCLFVAVIVLVSLFVIRAIKKNNTPRDGD